ITQDLLAELLGVQRPSLTRVASKLEEAGLILRGRRQITILDRKGLIKASCECYQLIRERVASHDSGPCAGWPDAQANPESAACHGRRWPSHSRRHGGAYAREPGRGIWRAHRYASQGD